MGWATPHIANLKAGLTVQFRPRGNSMVPLVKSGQLCTVVPTSQEPEVGDIVLCKINDREYLHLVKAVQGDRYQIGNNRGGINGWVSLQAIYGILACVED